MKPTTEQQKMQTSAGYWIVLIAMWLGMAARIAGWFMTARHDACLDMSAVLTRSAIAAVTACR